MRVFYSLLYLIAAISSSLLSLLVAILTGHASNIQAREQLIHLFFEENMEPKSTVVDWNKIDPIKQKCSACGIQRYLTWEMTWSLDHYCGGDKEGWKVGSTCKGRIEALHKICDYVAKYRKEARANRSTVFSPYKMAKVV